jgi:protein KRI1
MEILQADDRDLNQYVSIKKLAPYREDEWHVTHHQKMNKALILGGQKKEDKKVIKAHKKSKTEEGPSFEKPRKDKLTSDKEETLLGGEKKEDKVIKAHKKSKTEEGPSFEKPRKDKLTSDKEETFAKTNSEGKKVKTGKRSRSEEDTSSEEPEKDKHIGQEETDAKQKSTRSKRRNRRRKELHIPASRRDAYGI